MVLTTLSHGSGSTHLLPQKEKLFCSSFSRGWFVWNLLKFSLQHADRIAFCLFRDPIAANLNMHLRFLFNLLKYGCDNFISTACMAPLVFKRQSDWLWVSGTWPWERYRLFMLWKPSLSGWCACACVWYSFVMLWQTQETVLRCLSLARLAAEQFYWACPGSAGSSACSLLPSCFCFTACFQLSGG